MSTPEALMAAAEANDTLVTLAAGYRAKLEAAGFSPTMSEVMASQYHDALVHAILSKSAQS